MNCELYLKDITDKDYTHAKKVLEELKFKILVIIMTCIFKVIYYCLQMYWKTLDINLLKYMNLIQLIFCLHQTWAKLELLTKIDMLLMVKKSIQGGICHAIHRYAKGNNKYMKNFYKDIDCNSAESSYLMFLDATNLY